jgi:hypothetical protein
VGVHGCHERIMRARGLCQSAQQQQQQQHLRWFCTSALLRLCVAMISPPVSFSTVRSAPMLPPMVSFICSTRLRL